jgi:hypothetical protein
MTLNLRSLLRGALAGGVGGGESLMTVPEMRWKCFANEVEMVGGELSFLKWCANGFLRDIN